jgi:hypothetical protein
LEVGCGSKKQLGLVDKHTEPQVASGTQRSAHNPCFVTVVGLRGALGRKGTPTNGAGVVLGFYHSVPDFEGNIVALFTGTILSANLYPLGMTWLASPPDNLAINPTGFDAHRPAKSTDASASVWIC